MDIALTNFITLGTDRLALALLIAASIACVWLPPQADATPSSTSTLRKTIDISLVLLIITTGLVLLLRTAALADASLLESLEFVPKVIEKSHYGTTWLGRTGALLLMVLLWCFYLRKRQGSLVNIVFMLSVCSIAFFISGASHAGEQGLVTWENANNALHILGGCLWGGSVIIYLMLFKQFSTLNLSYTDTAHRLTLIATIALLTTLSTGLINAWLRLETLDALWTTEYGLTLVAKLGFVAIMMGIGALNRFVLIPKLARHEITPFPSTASAHLSFRNALSIDRIVFFIIIFAAAYLATLSPGHN